MMIIFFKADILMKEIMKAAAMLQPSNVIWGAEYIGQPATNHDFYLNLNRDSCTFELCLFTPATMIIQVQKQLF